MRRRIQQKAARAHHPSTPEQQPAGGCGVGMGASCCGCWAREIAARAEAGQVMMAGVRTYAHVYVCTCLPPSPAALAGCAVPHCWGGCCSRQGQWRVHGCGESSLFTHAHAPLLSHPSLQPHHACCSISCYQRLHAPHFSSHPSVTRTARLQLRCTPALPHRARIPAAVCALA